MRNYPSNIAAFPRPPANKPSTVIIRSRGFYFNAAATTETAEGGGLDLGSRINFVAIRYTNLSNRVGDTGRDVRFMITRLQLSIREIH